MQMEAELQRYRSLEEQRRNHESKESQIVVLLSSLRDTIQQGKPSGRNNTLDPPIAVSSSHVEPGKNLSSNDRITPTTVTSDCVPSRVNVVIVSSTGVSSDSVASSGSSVVAVSSTWQGVLRDVHSSVSVWYTQSSMQCPTHP